MKGKVAYVFIDASNLWSAQKVKGRFFDFQKLMSFLKETHAERELKAFYYTAFPANGTRDYDLAGKHKFFTYLKKGLDITVVKKELKRISVHTEERGDIIVEKGNMDVEMTIDVLHFLKDYDTAVFFTGDSDFLALISYLKRHGRKAYVYSSRNNVSEELRTGSDGYTDVLGIRKDIWGAEIRHKEQK